MLSVPNRQYLFSSLIQVYVQMLLSSKKLPVYQYHWYLSTDSFHVCLAIFGYLRDNFSLRLKEVINAGQRDFPAIISSNEPDRHKLEDTKKGFLHFTVIQYLVFKSRFVLFEAKNRPFGKEILEIDRHFAYSPVISVKTKLKKWALHSTAFTGHKFSCRQNEYY